MCRRTKKFSRDGRAEGQGTPPSAISYTPPLLKVIHGDDEAGPTYMLLDEGYYLGPFPASQAAANARHVDRRP
jgi:hypothetical protein